MYPNTNILRYILLTIPLITFTLLLAGCNTPVQETSTAAPRVRAAIESNGVNTVKATVFVEGPDGNALSGAIVIIKDDSNKINHLAYNAANCSYGGVLEAGNTAQFTVEAATILSDDVISLSIPYAKLEIAPNVTVFQDSLGNSVLSGKSVSTAKPIQIGWKNCGENVVYQVAIRTQLKTVYAVSTNACTVTIEGGAIPPGSYLLEIIAQKISGDILYRTASYYAVSHTAAPLISCNVY